MKRWGFGTHSSGGSSEPLAYEISGLIPFPKLLAVTVKIDRRDGEEFGGWFYHVLNGSDQKRRTPFLDLWVRDPKFSIAEAIYQAHRDAMICGERKSDVRFWKRKGDGVMTPKDRAEDWSYESRYPLFGALVWSYLESKTLPPWAAPLDSNKYSAKNMPPS